MDPHGDISGKIPAASPPVAFDQHNYFEYVQSPILKQRNVREDKPTYLRARPPVLCTYCAWLPEVNHVGSSHQTSLRQYCAHLA